MAGKTAGFNCISTCSDIYRNKLKM